MADDHDSIPYDPFTPSSPRPSSPPPIPSTPASSYARYSSFHPPRLSNDPSICSQEDAHSRRQEYDRPQSEHLEELDDYDAYSEGDRGHRRSYPGGSPAFEDGSGGDGCQEDMSSIHYPPTPITPTPLPKIPLFVLGVVIFSEPLTSTILFPFIYFMVTFSSYFTHLDSKWIQFHTSTCHHTLCRP
jgi:hypothetical protein